MHVEQAVSLYGKVVSKEQSVFTNHGLKLMGFEPLPEGESITAAFHILRVFAVRGITLTDQGCRIHEGEQFRFAVANSVNVMANALLGDSFVEDEAAWSKEVKAGPPYLMVHVGPSGMGTVGTGSMFQRKEDALWTHDCFSAAKRELEELEPKTVEPLLVALAASFSGGTHPVTFHECAREVFGITTRRQTVHDMKFRLSATAYVSSHTSQEALAERLERGLSLQQSLDAKVGRFFYMGLAEQDTLKRFLYLYLFIERYTHETFTRLHGRAGVGALIVLPDRLEKTRARFEDELRESATTIRHRFVWCALLAWPGLNDDDIDAFRELKSQRDRLSHGEITTVAEPTAARAAALASRMLLAVEPWASRPSVVPSGASDLRVQMERPSA